MKRLRMALMIWSGNAYACNRRYWGWITMRTAWEAARKIVPKSDAND